MTDYAALVTALYKSLGRWQKIANECSNRGATYHSAGYYQQIATGRIKHPDSDTATAIERTVGDFSAISASRRRAARRGLVVCPSVFARLESAKIARGGVTWDALLERAATLLEEEGL